MKEFKQSVERLSNQNGTKCIKLTKSALDMDTKSLKRFLNSQELAERLGKTPRYVQQLANDKIIPCIKLPGRDRLYDWEKIVEAFSRFEQKEIGATSGRRE